MWILLQINNYTTTLRVRQAPERENSETCATPAVMPIRALEVSHVCARNPRTINDFKMSEEFGQRSKPKAAVLTHSLVPLGST